MDKEQARFILRCFRPDGADAGNPDFAEALRLASEDRELGDWLAHERAHDATFSQAVAAIPLPTELHGAILAGLAIERGDSIPPSDALDQLFSDALATVHPPPGLRAELLSAMRRSKPQDGLFSRFAMPLAAAAGIVAALIIFRPAPHPAPGLTGISPPENSAGKPLAEEAVEVAFIREFESPTFKLDMQKPDQRAVFEHLKELSLPCPCCMPPGLVGVPGVGCRELNIDGRRGSVLCFDEREAGVVHLVVFQRKDVCGDFPGREKPHMGRKGRWATASWGHGDQVYVLLGATDPKKLAALF